MIDFECPHCGNRIYVKDSAAGMKGKCKNCGNAIKVPDATPLQTDQPDDFYQLMEERPTLAETPPHNPKRAQSAMGRQVPEVLPVVAPRRDQRIALAAGCAGLALLAASAWLPWMKIFTGSVSGIVGANGKIVFGVSLATGLAVAITYSLKTLSLQSALAASAWGTISTLWIGALLYNVATIVQNAVQDKDAAQNPFATMFATQISPGVGLYLAPTAGLIVCAAFGYVAFQEASAGKRRRRAWSLLGTQFFAVVAGLGLGGLLAQQPTASAGGKNDTAKGATVITKDANPRNPFANIFAENTREQKQSELAQLERKKAESDRARQRLQAFQVLRSRFYVEKQRFGLDERVIELSVKNGLDRPIRRVYFRGRLQSPGRTIPWVDDSFNYEIKGGLEPSEQAEWKLAPNMFGPWGSVEEKPGMVLSVEVVGVDGPDGKSLLKAEFDDSDQERLDALKKELGEPSDRETAGQEPKPERAHTAPKKPREVLRDAIEGKAKALIATYPTAIYNDELAPSDSAVDRAFEFVKEAPTASEFTSRSLSLLEMYVRRYAITHRSRTGADVAEMRKGLDEMKERLLSQFDDLVRKSQIEGETAK